MRHGTPAAPLEHFRANLPARPFCADDHPRRGGVTMRPQVDAVKAPYVQWNSPGRISAVLLDVDRPEGGAAWIDAGMPPPNLIVSNPRNGHAKLGYLLDVPVATSGKARKAPREMLARAEVGLVRALTADPGFSGSVAVTNNPAHPDWIVRTATGRPYTLGELLDSVPAPHSRVERRETIGAGRNCTVFDEVRTWAYPMARAARARGDFLAWQNAVKEQAHRLNAFTVPLTRREVDRIAQSVARWTWDRADLFGGSVLGDVKRSRVRQSRDREPMTPEEARDRMTDGAAWTNTQRRNATRDRIVRALGELATLGDLEPTAAEVARRAGLHRVTVARFLTDRRRAGPGN